VGYGVSFVPRRTVPCTAVREILRRVMGPSHFPTNTCVRNSPSQGSLPFHTSESCLSTNDRKIVQTRPIRPVPITYFSHDVSQGHSHIFTTNFTESRPFPHDCSTFHHNISTMIPKQTMKHHERHQSQGATKVFEAEQDNSTSCSSWNVAPDKTASVPTHQKRVQWKDDDTCGSSTTVDCRWGDSSWSSNDDLGRQSWASTTPRISPSVTSKTKLLASSSSKTTCSSTSPSSTPDCLLECPKRRISMDADQLVAFLTQAMDIYHD
jgi:hypothetical protein